MTVPYCSAPIVPMVSVSPQYQVPGTLYEFRVYELATERQLIKSTFSKSSDRSERDQTFFYSSDAKHLILRPAIPEDSLIVLDASNGQPLDFPQTRLLDCVDGENALVLKNENEIQLLHLNSGDPIGKPVANGSTLLGARLNASNTRFIAIQSGRDDELSTQVEIYDLGQRLIVGPAMSRLPRTGLALSRDGRTLLITRNPLTGKIARFAVDTGVEHSLSQESSEEVLDLIPSNGAVWAVTWDKYRTGSALLDTGEETRLPPPKAGLPQYAFSQDGLLVSLEESVFRLSDGSRVAPQLTHGSWIRCQAFAPNGHELASGGDDATLRIWDFSSLTPPRLSLRMTDPIPDARFSPDGLKIAIISLSGLSLRAFDATSGRPLSAPKADGLLFDAIRFSSDGSRAVIYNGNGFPGLTWRELRSTGCAVWNLQESSKPLRWFERDSGFTTCAEFSHAGKRLLTCTEQRASLWDADSGRLFFQLERSCGGILSGHRFAQQSASERITGKVGYRPAFGRRSPESRSRPAPGKSPTLSRTGVTRTATGSPKARVKTKDANFR